MFEYAKKSKENDFVSKRLAQLRARMASEIGTFVAYPINAAFDYSELFQFLSFPINNLGDPFAVSNLRLNTHDIERDVVTWFCEIFGIDWSSSWGYVTSGGTEGNFYGLFLGREACNNPVIYFSEASHYSVRKIVRVMNADHCVVKVDAKHRMDIEDLKRCAAAHKGRDAVLLANIGSTMMGAVDDVVAIRRTLTEAGVPRTYIHCDAALSGMILPFVAKPQRFSLKDGADSVSVSGHKFIGSPIPCGVVVAQRSHVESVGSEVQYVGARDSTLPGSRNGITPLFLWYAIQRMGNDGFRDLVQHTMNLAQYAVDVLNEAGVPAWRHDNSVTVVFPTPDPEIAMKWRLATEDGQSHIITMPHVTKLQIDGLAADIASDLHRRRLFGTGFDKAG